MVRTQQVLDSWKNIREDTVAAVREFPAGDFDFRLMPEMQSFREITRHILQAGEGMVGMMLAGEDDFSDPGFRPRMLERLPVLPESAGPGELADALEASIDRLTGELAARPADFFAHIMTRFDGAKVTRLEMLQFVKEHELTHRTQLFVCLRIKGIVPPTTRRRLARAAK